MTTKAPEPTLEGFVPRPSVYGQPTPELLADHLRKRHEFEHSGPLVTCRDDVCDAFWRFFEGASRAQA